MLINVLLSWIFLSILVGAVASLKKKRDGLHWFFLSLVITPLIAFIVILVAGSTLKRCPKCAEEVKKDAVVCRFCGYDFPEKPDLERPCDACGVYYTGLGQNINGRYYCPKCTEKFDLYMRKQ